MPKWEVTRIGGHIDPITPHPADCQCTAFCKPTPPKERRRLPYKVDFNGEEVEDYQATIEEYGLGPSGAGPSPKKGSHASRVLHLVASKLGWRG